MTVNENDLVPGALIHVTAVVLGEIGPDGIRIKLGRASHAFDGLVPLADIIYVDPKPLAAGDRVRHVDDRKGRILALYEDEAWVRLDDSSYSITVKLANLRRV